MFQYRDTKRHKRHKEGRVFAGWLQANLSCAFCASLWLRFVRDFQLFHGDAIAPEAHEPLLWRVAEGVFAVLAVEGRVAEAVEEFPGAVEIERVDHHRLEPIAPATFIN